VTLRLPQRAWEWALQFAPAAVILLAVGYEVAFIPRGGTMIVGLKGAVVGSWFALPLCFLAAFFLTKPHPSLALRVLWIVLLAVGVAAVNCGIAFAGCMLVVP
jgi:hypothetical protein